MNEYITIAQAAKVWDVSIRRVNYWCNQGRIEGATKFGNVWAIPKNANKPKDKRVTTGKYKKE